MGFKNINTGGEGGDMSERNIVFGKNIFKCNLKRKKICNDFHLRFCGLLHKIIVVLLLFSVHNWFV